MKLQGLILICLLLSLGGCSGSDDATAEASPTPQATKQVAGDDGTQEETWSQARSKETGRPSFYGPSRGF